MKRKSFGFTIVELLIVIVIIGILAALVIAVYNGIQQRALNTSRIASAKELLKIVNAYVAQEGKYPNVSIQACIGSGYTDWGGDGTLDCHIKTSSEQHPSVTVDFELKKVAATPKVETSEVHGTSNSYRGYLLYRPLYVIDGQPGRSMLDYWLNGTGQNCGIPGILSSVTGGYASNGAVNHVANYGGTTLCRVAINEP